MKKSDIKSVAKYFSSRDKKELEGIELPATIKAIVEEFDAIPVQGVVKATLTDVSETITDGVKWIREKIKI